MENTDRELLELAAKVSGIPTPNWIGTEHEWLGREGVIFNDEYDCNQVWNPLADDGDAFRLAVSLMEFEPYKSRGSLSCISSDAEATRRAIVRAAAEIGKVMT